MCRGIGERCSGGDAHGQIGLDKRMDGEKGWGEGLEMKLERECNGLDLGTSKVGRVRT